MSPAALLFLTTVAAGALSAVQGAPTRPALTAVRTSTPPVIDGDLSDPVWITAPPVSHFRQSLPDEGQPETGHTEIRLLYDNKALYFAIRCQTPDPSSVVANLTRRDDWAYSDSLAIDVDTEGDHQRAFRFEVNAANIQRDGVRTGDGSVAYEWDAVWTSAARVTKEGWSAEVAIPFTSLRYSNPAHPDWRIQFRRYVPAHAENDLWIFIPRSVQGQMQRYGRIVGLENLPRVHGLVLQPFATTRFRSERAPAVDGVPTGNWFTYGLGLDARLSLTPGLSLVTTVLPDFGQVEADPAVLNLTRFEVYQTERRPFFLEGADLFALNDASGNPLGTQLFYSRRLGATPPDPYLPSGTVEREQPDVDRLWTATKLIGRIGNKVRLALLDGVAAQESAQVGVPGGPTLNEGVAPLSNFFVGRLKSPLGANFTGGLSFTSVNRQEPVGSLGLDGLCPDTDAPASSSGRCTHDAQSAAADLAWQTSDGGWVASGVLYGSRIAGGPARTLADGTVIASGDEDLGGRVELTKSAGNVVGGVVYNAAGPKLDLNDAGYLQQQNFQQLYGRVGWRLFNVGTLQDTTTQLETWLTDSWDGVALGRYYQLSHNTTWKNRWNVGGAVGYETRYFDNRDAGDGTLTERPANFSAQVWGSSPFQRAIAWGGWLWGRNNWHGGAVTAGPYLMARIGRRVNCSVGTQASVNNGDPRWVATNGVGAERQYVLGAQNSASVSTTVRSTISFTDKMTLQLYSQLFFSSVQYTALYGAQAIGRKPTVFLDALDPVAGDPHAYDSRDAVLNVNVVFRWEYLPGSVLYLVYSRYNNGGDAPMPVGPGGVPLPARTFDWASLGQGSTQDVFQVKLSYYWGT